jgi:hypothetical protein
MKAEDKKANLDAIEIQGEAEYSASPFLKRDPCAERARVLQMHI